MKVIERYSAVLVLTVLSIMLMLHSLFYQSVSSNPIMLLSIIYRALIDGLTHLSLLSGWTNILAWGIYLMIALIPIGWSYYQMKIKKRVGHAWWLSVLFSIFLLYVIYGSLNHWFVQMVDMISHDGYTTVIDAAIMMMVLVFVITSYVIDVMQKGQDNKRLFSYFQLFLLITAIGYTLPISQTIVNGWIDVRTSDVSLLQRSIMFASSAIDVSAKIMMLILITQVITILGIMKQYMFDVALKGSLIMLHRITTIMIYFMLIAPLLLGIFQLVFLKDIQHAMFYFQFPLIELLIAFVLMVISRIMITSMAIAQENEQFI